MTKFVKKPAVIDAFIWTGDIEQAEDPRWIREAMNKNDVWVTKRPENDTCHLAIRTASGVVFANQGDFIIKGVDGEIYPCPPGVFAATYDRVTSDDSTRVVGTFPHEWQESRVGHGGSQCTFCHATMLEVGAIGDMNYCQERKNKYMRTEI